MLKDYKKIRDEIIKLQYENKSELEICEFIEENLEEELPEMKDYAKEHYNYDNIIELPDNTIYNPAELEYNPELTIQILEEMYINKKRVEKKKD